MSQTTDGIRVLVTSIVRHVDQNQTSGYARVIDCENKRVLMTSPVRESTQRARDLNPRGGLRGARGVAVFGDRLLIANAERLMVFDTTWKLVDDLTHPLMGGGGHDVLPETDGTWITCTSSDLLIKLSWQGGLTDVWEWRRNQNLAREFGFGRLPQVDRTKDYRDPESMRSGVRNLVHLNAVTRGLGGLLLSFGRILSLKAYRERRVAGAIGKLATILRIKPRGQRARGRGSSTPAGRIEGSSSAIVLLGNDGTTRVLHRVSGTGIPSHNVVLVDGLLIYNDSDGGRVVAARPGHEAIEHSVKIPGEPSFARGLLQIGAMEFLSGSQAPLAVYHVDLAEGRIRNTFPLQGDPREAVHGICLIPDHFNDPPARLACT